MEVTMSDLKSDLKDSAETAREAVSDGVDAARQRFQKLGDDVQDRYKKVSSDVRRGAERAQKEIRRGAERAKGAYDDLSKTAEKSYRRVRSQATTVSREVSLYVRDNPGKSVLIAAGVGFLLGLLTRRGSRDDE